MDTPQSPTQDPVLDELYIALSTLEQREVDVAQLGRTYHRKAILTAMLPLKREINKLEGKAIYPEAEFDYAAYWESPEQAAAAAASQPEPMEAAMQIIRYNMEMDEYGFTCEFIHEFQAALLNASCADLTA